MKFSKTKILISEKNVLVLEEILSELRALGLNIGNGYPDPNSFIDEMKKASAKGDPYNIAVISGNHLNDSVVRMVRSIRNDENMAGCIIILINVTEPVDRDLLDTIVNFEVDAFMAPPFSANRFLKTLSESFMEKNPGEGIFFKVDVRSEINHIITPGDISKIAIAEFDALRDFWLNSAVKGQAIDFSDLRDEYKLPASMLRAMAQFYQKAAAMGQTVATLNASDEVFEQINTEGLERLFQAQKRASKESKTEVKKSRKVMDVRFINPFLEATKEVMLTQVHAEVKVDKPFILADKKLPNVTVGGVIQLSGEKFKGAVCLAFDRVTLIQIYKSMTGDDPEGVDDLINDCAGELLNIIHGNAKKEINENLGFGLAIGLPSVFVKDQLSEYLGSKSLWVVLPFKFSDGKFYVLLSSES